MVHMPGSKMIQSDALSRRPDYIPEVDNDNEDIIMLPDNLFINLIDVDLQERIAVCEDRDREAAEALMTLLELNPTALQHEKGDWTLEKFNGRNVLFFKGKNYIPRNDDLRRDIARMFHDHETAGHPGELETFNAIRQHYWWPGL